MPKVQLTEAETHIRASLIAAVASVALASFVAYALSLTPARAFEGNAAFELALLLMTLWLMEWLYKWLRNHFCISTKVNANERE